MELLLCAELTKPGSLRRNVVIAVVLSTLLLLLAAPFLPKARSIPRLEITLATPPAPQTNKWTFWGFFGPNGTDCFRTQHCYRAELRIKNAGPGSIYFTNPHIYSLEIQRTNSSAWEYVHQGILHVPTNFHADSANIYPQFIPSDTSKWRVSCRFRRIYDPRDFVNAFIVDVLKIEYRIGTEPVFTAHSPEWDIKHY
jgi:hypothetical protein